VLARRSHEVRVAGKAEVVGYAREVSLIPRAFLEFLEREAKAMLGPVPMHRFARARAEDSAQMEG
jgi:hypothetical protein